MPLNKAQRKTSIIAGVLILIAYAVLMITSLESLILVMLMEIISGFAVILIAVIMFPILKPYNDKLDFGYLVIKLFEGGLLIIAGILFLSQITLLLEIRDWIYVSHAYYFIPGALIFYYLLYQSKLVPRFISVWGFIALALLLIVNLMEMTGNSPEWAMLLYSQIMLNEICLAIWFIVKGFNEDIITSRAVKADQIKTKFEMRF